ncbi:TP901 family phage tail tape measure protein [Methanococcus maripaludis]|uniref:TP901 family phage tail tape measure protein n=1 Tax=Methanococcus maripaludis TaxID=39152 RepID=A0A7J9P515_METMI|nr:phage tail tape measure protein [Methanococcus maripaludis]MBA2858291.1 TP901 family phage tail tape measure protein [Methanococcus maripaludis]
MGQDVKFKVQATEAYADVFRGLQAEAESAFQGMENAAQEGSAGAAAAIGLVQTKAGTASSEIQSMAKKAQTSFRDLESSMRSAGVAAAAISAPLVAGLGVAIDTGMEYEQSLKNVQALLKSSEDQYKELYDFGIEVSRTSIYAANEIGEAMYYSASAGQTNQQIMASLNDTLSLAAATQSDVAQTSDLMNSSFSIFQLEASESSRVASTYAEAIATSQANLTKLQYSMRQVGTVAAGMKYDIEDTTAALMTLYQAGYQGEQAGTILSSALTTILDLTPEAKATLQKYKITESDLLEDGAVKSWEDVIAVFENADMNQQDLATIFGETSLKGMISMIGQGSEALKTYQDNLHNASGAAEEMKEIQLNSISGMWALFKSDMNAVELNVFGDMRPEIEEIIGSFQSAVPFIDEFARASVSGVVLVIDTLKPVASTVADIFSSIPEEGQQTIAVLTGVVGAGAAVAAPLLLVGSTIAGNLALASGMLSGIAGSSALAGIVGAFSGGGIAAGAATAATTVSAGLASVASAALPVVAVVGTIAAAAYFGKRAWDDNRDSVDQVILSFKQAGAAVRDTVNPILEDHKDIIDKTGQVAGIALNLVSGAISHEVGRALEAYNTLTAMYDSNAYHMKDVIDGIAGALGWLLDYSLQVIEDILDGIIWMYNNWDAIWNQMHDTVGIIWNQILETTGTGVNEIIEVMNTLIDAYNVAAGALGKETITELKTVNVEEYQWEISNPDALKETAAALTPPNTEVIVTPQIQPVEEIDAQTLFGDTSLVFTPQVSDIDWAINPPEVETTVTPEFDWANYETPEINSPIITPEFNWANYVLPDNGSDVLAAVPVNAPDYPVPQQYTVETPVQKTENVQTIGDINISFEGANIGSQEDAEGLAELAAEKVVEKLNNPTKTVKKDVTFDKYSR